MITTRGLILTITKETIKADVAEIARYIGTTKSIIYGITEKIERSIEQFFEETGEEQCKVIIPSELAAQRYEQEIEKQLTTIDDITEKLKNTEMWEATIRRESEKPPTCIQRTLKPRKDWQQKSYWLRIRSNPHRRSYR